MVPGLSSSTKGFGDVSPISVSGRAFGCSGRGCYGSFDPLQQQEDAMAARSCSSTAWYLL